MLNLDENWTRYLRASFDCGSSLIEAVNATQRLSHTRWSSLYSLVTRVQSQSVKHNHSGVTASCSVQCTASSTALRVVQLDLQDPIWMMFVLKIISKLCSAENNECRSEEATKLGHIGLLSLIYCL